MTSVACMMQRGGNPWFRASRMACSSVTLRVQLLAREKKHKAKLSLSLSLHIHQILITGMDESSCEQIIMQNIAPVDAILGIQFRICQTSSSSRFTDAVCMYVCIWHNKTFCSDNTFSDSTLIHSQRAFLVMKQSSQQMEIEGKIADWNEQTENKSMPKLWASSGYDGSLAEFSTTILNLPACILLLLTPCHWRHIPIASPSLISSLMNHFTCS